MELSDTCLLYPYSFDESPTSRLRSTHPSTFNIKMDCIFCVESQASLVSTLCGFLDKNNELISVRRIDWKADLEKEALERNDEWGLQVHGRVAGLGDLVVAEAKYHGSCMTAF